MSTAERLEDRLGTGSSSGGGGGWGWGGGGGWGPASSREPSLVNPANEQDRLFHARARVYIEAQKKKKEKLQLSGGK